MTERATVDHLALQRRVEVIAGQAMAIIGIDHDSVQRRPDGSQGWVTRADALQRMSHHVTACPDIGTVGLAMLRGAGVKL